MRQSADFDAMRRSETKQVSARSGKEREGTAIPSETPGDTDETEDQKEPSGKLHETAR